MKEKIRKNPKLRNFLYWLFFISVPILIIYAVASAAPPGSPYNPGETLSPSCSPGDANCKVLAPVTGLFNVSTSSISLVAGTNITLASTTDSITISASGGTFTTTTINGLSATAYTFASSSIDTNIGFQITTSSPGTVNFNTQWLGTLADSRITSASTWNAKITTSSLSETITGINYDNVGGIFSLTSGYEVPLTASTSNWQSFYDTPSGRITAGTNLSWSGNTLNTVGVIATSSPFSAGYIPYATSSSAITNSNIFQSGSNIGIGTTTPNNLLQVYDLLSFNNTDFNTQSGYQAGKNIVSGAQYNTFIGNGAGLSSATLSSSTADFNTAIGYRALYSNTTGYNNSFLGYAAGYNNTTGYRNTFLGSDVGYYNTTGYNNTFLGFRVGNNNTTGSNNSFLGTDAGISNTTGDSNSFLGAYAGYSNTTGYNNSFLGYQAGGSNTTGYNNSFLGHNVGLSNTTGVENLFLGSGAGRYNNTGSGNSILGYQAGYGVSNTQVSNSVILGYQSGYSLATSTANILLGYQAGYSLVGGSASLGSNNIVIGHNVDLPTTTATNTLSIANLIYGTGLSAFTSPTTTVSAGNVGIGTTTPAYGLVVGNGTIQKDIYIPYGGLCVDNNAAGCPASPLAGMIYASSTSITGIDLAENYPILDETIEAGDVVALNKAGGNLIEKSSLSYQTNAIGVISTAPGVLLGSNATSSRPVALAGRVPVKVSNENGAIKVGDFLTSSDIPGAAMKATEPGRVIGMAMENFDGLTGKIMVFVNPHWNLGSFSESLAEETEVLGQFASAIQTVLKNLGLWIKNGVAQLKEVIADKISTKELCLEDVCVNKDQLKELLERNQVPQSSGDNAGQPSEQLQIIETTETTETTEATTETILEPEPINETAQESQTENLETLPVSEPIPASEQTSAETPPAETTPNE